MRSTGTLREYQEWVARFDRERGWDRVLPTATCAHLAEEVGEVCRAVLRLSGYKPAPEGDGRQELSEELADATTFLVKLAYTFGVDLEEALLANRRKCERRYTDPRQGQVEASRYLESTRTWLLEHQDASEPAATDSPTTRREGEVKAVDPAEGKAGDEGWVEAQSRGEER